MEEFLASNKIDIPPLFHQDFLVRNESGKTLVLEIKGVDSPQDQTKRDALAPWVEAVNAHGGFGTWASDVVVGDATDQNLSTLLMTLGSTISEI